MILSAAVDFHFNFIFGSFPLHLASVAQFCMDVDTVSPSVFFFAIAFSSVLQFSLDKKPYTTITVPVLLTLLLTRDLTPLKKRQFPDSFNMY